MGGSVTSVRNGVNMSLNHSQASHIVEMSELPTVTVGSVRYNSSDSVTGTGLEERMIDPEARGTWQEGGEHFHIGVWLTLPHIPSVAADPPFSPIPLPHASYMPCRRRPSLSGVPRQSTSKNLNSPFIVLKVNASLWDIER